MKSSSTTTVSSSSSFSFLFIFVSCYSLLLSHCVVVVDSFSLSSEREALLSLLNNFSFESPVSIQLNWNNLSTTTTPCQWSGVGCNTQKTHVVSLNLSNYWITGPLGPQIGRLKYLKSLDLRCNRFNASIPTELCNCSHLQHLDLTRNEFTGELPEAVGNLQQLNFLSISNNLVLGGIPTELWNCSHLQHLDLSWNNFTGVLPPEVVSNLHQLNFLDISWNHFSGTISESLFQISSLESVDLRGNNFNGSIPLNIGNATNMKRLDLNGNSLHGTIPTSLSNCTKLELLVLANNGGLSGEIPLGVWRIPTLAYIDVRSNNLSGELPVEMTELHHLENIKLNNNQFSGLIPQALGINSTGLGWVYLSNNSFSGEIPPNFCFGKQLQYMHLDQNKLHGSFPSSYTQNCYSLQELILKENNLNGSLPHFEKNSSSLSTLDISGNNIHGQIPWSICNLVSTLDIIGFSLDLSENQMNGVLPHCLGSSNSLSSLNLRNNDFTGTIPPNFTSDGLQMLDLNGNRFEGKIPRIHSRFLRYLDLGNNQLNDTFPFFLEEMISSDYLEILVLRSNKLYGPLKRRRLHSNSTTFSKLKILDISSNYFTGDLPLEFFLGLDAMRHIQYTGNKWINYPQTSSVVIYKGRETTLNHTFMDEFRAIDMSNNTFQGTIPRSIGELVWLKMLNLSGNNLTAHIPSSLGNLRKMESLDLSQNKLSGEIPRHLTDLQFLSVLNLSHNNLTGRIPSGRHIQTFSNDSFSGNPGLCGKPLSMECGDDADKDNHQDPFEEKESVEDSNNSWNFGWEPVVIGYGCGVVIGLVIQYFLFTKAFLYRWFG